MDTQLTQWMTQREVAGLLGVSVETLRRWRRASTGPAARRLGPRVVRYDRAAVLAWLSTRGAA